MIVPAFHHFETVGSTNDVALKMLAEGAPEGTVVTAGCQTTGRGRRGRVWLDEPGMSVLMSVVLGKGLAAADTPKLAFVVALGVRTAIRKACCVEPVLKWPNDVVLSSRKLAGILIESAGGPHGTAAVAGVGINVNQADFDAEISHLATSLRLETGSLHCVERLARLAADEIFGHYERFLAAGFEDTLAEWRKHMWGVGEDVEVAGESDTVKGVITGIDEAGALLVLDSTGATHAVCAAQTIKTIRN